MTDLVSGMPFTTPYPDLAAGEQTMFCAQCSQTANGIGCYSQGECGKKPEVAKLQDVLVHHLIRVGWYAHQLRALAAKGVSADLAPASKFITDAMFPTLTNVNFDPKRFDSIVTNASAMAESLKKEYALGCAQCGVEVGAPDGESPQDIEDYVIERRKTEKDPNAGCLCEMLLYGLKGVCAYADHAKMGGKSDERIDAFIAEALAFLASPAREDMGACLGMCLRAGEANFWTMELLSTANKAFGTPEPTKVPVTSTAGKCILVSGHDLFALDALLAEAKKSGVNVYTHGEMLPAHSYPKLKAHGNLVGHVGGAWNKQQEEFCNFPGAILITSNCIIKPHIKYQKKLFTWGPVGWPQVPHVGGLSEPSNWDAVIACAQKEAGFKADGTALCVEKGKKGGPSPCEPLMVGFGHDTVIGAAETVLAGVKAGLITRFFLIGGCDGDEEGRSYYTELAEQLPETAVILTLGCGKYRISDAARKRLGEVGDTGIPRVLDVGQCNDTFSAVQIAVALAGALSCEVTDLPLSIILSWLEQKAVAVLLTCLHLKLKPLRVGPTLPAFLTKDVLNYLVENCGLKVIGDPATDIADMCSVSGMA